MTMKYLKLIVAICLGVVVAACQGPNDPYFIIEEKPAPDNGGGNEQEYEPVPAGEIRLFSDKTTIAADGTDKVTFTVIYGSESGNVNISDAGTTRLVYTLDGVETKMEYADMEFSSTTEGEYTFKATAYRGGVITSNQIVITVGDNKGDDGGETPAPTDGYTISVDKTTIEADGVDTANFTVLDANGVNLMETSLSSIYFIDINTGERLERKSEGFSSVLNGEYTFKATYRGEETVNSVTIKVQNRAKYEQYKQRVAIYQLTGTWCTYCPQMVAGLEGMVDTWKEHSLVMAAHAGSVSDDDPFAISTAGGDLGTLFLSAFGGQGYPSCVYDLVELSGERSPSKIQKIIEGYLRDYPATCGVKIASTRREGKTITIDAAVTSSTGGSYDLGYVILLDNQSYSQGTSLDGKYHDIICAFSSNLMAMGDGKVSLKQGEEHTKTFTIENFPEVYKDSDLRVVVFALSSKGGRTINDNLTVCSMGGSQDYELN